MLLKLTRRRVEGRICCRYLKQKAEGIAIKTYQFWQQHSHPVELDTEEKLYQRMDYIHYNPVEAGIVLSPEYYLYSSAASYAGLKETLIDVILI
jgi:hypothetical protein